TDRRKELPMKARAKFVATCAVVVALLAFGLWAGMFAGSSSAGTLTANSPTVPQMTTGSFSMSYSANTCESQVNSSYPACWNCTYPVDLDQVTITVDPPLATSPKANEEAVRLGAGCTG